MKTTLCSLAVVMAGIVATTAKPPAVKKAAPLTANDTVPRAGVVPPDTFLHWLLELDSGPAAVALPAANLLQTISGLAIPAFKASDPVDASMVGKIGLALDGLLPRLNRPDGAIRAAKEVSLVPSLVEQELTAVLAGQGGVNCTPLADAAAARLGASTLAEYPTLRLDDPTNHRSYYLGVAFIQTEQNNSATQLLEIDPKSAATRITQPGACLLVVLEHNAKAGDQLAFLNWRLLDLQQTKLHARLGFEAAASDVLVPAASIVDGRRGRD